MAVVVVVVVVEVDSMVDDDPGTCSGEVVEGVVVRVEEHVSGERALV
jgi:hypothetical protein